jgi:hypothetical protein
MFQAMRSVLDAKMPVPLSKGFSVPVVWRWKMHGRPCAKIAATGPDGLVSSNMSITFLKG